MVTIALVLLFLSSVLVWLRRSRDKNGPPVLSGAWPLIGHAHLLIGDTLHLWNFIKRLSYESLKAGGVLTFYLGPKTFYLVTDPEDSLVIANSCVQKANFYDYAKPWLGDGLFIVGASMWKKQRTLLNPAFNQVVLDGFLGVFNEQSRRLVEELKVEVGKAPFDLGLYIRRNALETICLNALGTDISEKNELNGKYVNAVEQVFNIFVTRFQKFWLQSQFLFNRSSLKKRQDEYVKILHDMSNSVLNKKKTNYVRARNGTEIEEKTKGKNFNYDIHIYDKIWISPKFKPFIDLLLELSEEKHVFNDQEIREQVDTMIISGHDTSATALMYTILLVGSYLQVQQKISEELRTVFGNEDRDVTPQDLSRLVYLEAVIKESLRFCPLAPVTGRLLERDVKIRNWTLRKGSTCIMMIYGIHRHPMWGPDAEEFRPERWLDPATLPDCPHAFAAFNMGRRNCIGKSYAYMSMKTTLVHVFRNYRVSGDHTKLVAKFEVLLKPVSGHYVTLERIK